MNISGKSETKDSKFNATVFLFGTIFMLAFIAFLVFYLKLPWFVNLILAVFTLFVLAHAYQAFKNSIFSDKSLPFEESEISLTVDGMSGNEKGTTSVCYADRLRKLEAIYSDGLLTKEEYEEKRKEILDEDWGT